MLMVLLLLSIAGEDAPSAPLLSAAKPVMAPRAGRCENARTQNVDQDRAKAPALRSLAEEPLANAYRPVVRHADCDRPVIVANRVGQVQR